MTAFELNAFRESLRLLRTRRFGTFFVATLLSNIGTWAQQVAQPWLLLSLGASPFIVGLDAFAQGAPVWLLTLFGGMLADRGDRRHVIAGFQSVQMLCPLTIVALLLAGSLRPWMVVCISLVVGITDALSMPSFQSIVATIVPRDRLAAGLALNATQFNLSRILGPALAGVLLVGIGAVGCYATNAASYLPFIVVALWILPRGRPRPDGQASAALFASVREALRAPQLRAVLATVFLTGLLCGPLITFAPVLVRDAFGGNAAHFSALVVAFGGGGLLGAVGLLFVGVDVDRRRLSAAFALAYGGVVALAAVVPLFHVLPLLLALAGLCMSFSNTAANTQAQALAPAQLRGQTVSLYMLAIRGGTALGSLLTGLSVGAFGVRDALLLNGMLAIAAHGLLWRSATRGAAPH